MQINNSAPITYSGAASLIVKGGSGTNTFNVVSTSAATPVTLNTGAGIDQVNVLSTRGRLDINNPGGEDTVTVGNTRAGLTIGGDSLGNVEGDVYVSGQGRTYLYVDDSQDAVARNATISYDGTYGTLEGSAASGLIRWVPSTPSFSSGVIDVDVYAGFGANTFTVKGSGIMQQLYLRTHGDRGVAGQANLAASTVRLAPMQRATASRIPNGVPCRKSQSSSQVVPPKNPTATTSLRTSEKNGSTAMNQMKINERRVTIRVVSQVAPRSASMRA